MTTNKPHPHDILTGFEWSPDEKIRKCTGSDLQLAPIRKASFSGFSCQSLHQLRIWPSILGKLFTVEECAHT